MALPLAELDSTLEARSLASAGYVDLTLDTMRAFGIVVARPPSGAPFEVAGSRRYRPADFEVEGDWSGAAFLLVAGAIASREGIEVSGLSPGSSQPDRAVVGALEAAGALVEMGDSGCRVARGRPVPFTFDARDCPDLFPPLAVLAAACPGESRIAGVGRLRFKESDRAAAIVGLLGALGTACSLEGDELVVSGGAIGGGRVDPRGDHRIAMAAAVAGLAASGRVEIPGAECVAKSWPDFFGDLAGLLP